MKQFAMAINVSSNHCPMIIIKTRDQKIIMLTYKILIKEWFSNYLLGQFQKLTELTCVLAYKEIMRNGVPTFGSDASDLMMPFTLPCYSSFSKPSFYCWSTPLKISLKTKQNQSMVKRDMKNKSYAFESINCLSILFRDRRPRHTF